MEDLLSRRLEALSAHVEGIEAALSARGTEGAPDSMRRLARSLARAATEADLADVASRAEALRDAPDAELESTAQALIDFLRQARPAAPSDGHQLLVVEDSKTVAAALLAYLEDEARTLHLATSAEEAERILEEHPIDLVILDLILPDRDGRDLLLQLREDAATANLPVLVLSASTSTVARAECLAVGASDFLAKPADPQLLRASVARHLSDYQRDADARTDRTTGFLSRAGLTEVYRALQAPSGKVEGPLAVAILVVTPYDLVLRDRGREEGDRLMKAVAGRISESLPDGARLGRWSEAELVVLLPGTNPQDARDLLADGLSRLLGAGGPVDEYRSVEIVLSFAAGVTIADRGADLREAAFAAEQSLQVARPEGERLSFVAPPALTGPSKILLVEDDRVTATLIQHRLVREGFEVMDFLNGEDAYRWASTGAFDLAILDVKVPGMDGFEILERLRAIPRLEDVPIIMLTGLGSEDDVVRGLELGANDYMPKPFSPAELLARVRRLVAEYRTPRAEGLRPTRAGDPPGVRDR